MHRTLLLSFLVICPVFGQDLDLLFEERNIGPATEMLATGEYDLLARLCEAAIKRGMKSPEWRLLRLRALRLQGREIEVQDEVQLAVKTFPDQLELLMLQHDNALSLGRRDIAAAALKAINEAAGKKPAKDRTAAEWVALGQAAVALGADSQKVIRQYFQMAQKVDPKFEAAYLAEGYLAFAKNDGTRAAEIFRAGLKAHGETADLRTGLALAYSNGDREKQQENLIRALEINPMQTEALLCQAEGLIRAEKFLEAEAAIQKVIEICETSPKAWALRAAVALLSATSPDKVKSSRLKGLELWEQNPLVDHTLGRIISRAYRFAEGAAYQRDALSMDTDYMPAKIQLCQDLLRLGEETEAWALASEIRDKDGYNVEAHNIGLLEKQMSGYTTQSSEDFILKMPKRDWPMYGESALALLREAKSTFTVKYGLDLKRPVIVEFFGAQQDFAIRTFGSLGGQGLLGVCFGTVITMNSPGGLAHSGSNWEATLWHEYCHVITLSLTKNRMPRWLSEGISVYEEKQHNLTWGMEMNANFRRMILEDSEATPLGQLSSAFLNAKDHEHTMFAYYQSSQVVSYLMETFGADRLQAILRDLAAGTKINSALQTHTMPLGALEKNFDRYLKSKAEAYGKKADWSEPKPEDLNPLEPGALASYQEKHPQNLWVLHQQIEALMAAADWIGILPLADRLIDLVPEDISEQGGYHIKASIFRKLQRTAEETAILRHIAEHDSSSTATFLRLMELDLAEKDWKAVKVQAQRAIAINPFLRTAQQAMGEASDALGESTEAISAYQRVLLLDPAGAAMTHFKLAKLMRQSDEPKAKRHLLDALALAPRFREGHELLKKWP